MVVEGSRRNRLQIWLRKMLAVFLVYFQEGITYRANGVVWIMTDVTIAVTMPLVWASASSLSSGPIQGFSSGDFVLYYLCYLLLGSFITCHMMWEIGMEIKEGHFSAMMLRPINYLAFSFQRNIAWRVIRFSLFLPFFVMFLFFYQPALKGQAVHLTPEFFLAFFLGHCVSFFFVTALAMTALFVEESQSIFETYYAPALILGGQMVPIETLPSWAVSIAKFLPFYYTAGFPTEVLIGRVTGAKVYEGIGFQLLFIVLSILTWKVLWAKGTRHYSGVGM
jgi:ABC-2 type transport system permease protein